MLTTSIASEFRYSLRSIGRNKGLAVALVTLIGLGVGSTTAIYSVLDHVLFHPFAYRSENRLVWLQESNPFASVTLGPDGLTLRQLRSMMGPFTAIEVLGNRRYYSSSPGDPAILRAGLISPTLFSTLEISPVLGRSFEPSDVESNSPSITILGYNFWMRRFGGSKDVIGRTLILNDTSYLIVGVAPLSLNAVAPGQDLWVPLQFMENMDYPRGGSMLGALGLLRMGATLDQGRAALGMALGRAAADGQGSSLRGFSAVITRPGGEVLGSIRFGLYVLQGSVGLLLLAACANCATLQLVRNASREHDLAIRAALGARRSQIATQLGIEYGVLGIVGGVAGLLIAQAASRVVQVFHPSQLIVLSDISINSRVFVFGMITCIGSVVLFGILPILRASDIDVAEAIKGKASNLQTRRSQRILVAAQMAVSVAILVESGLMIQTYRHLIESDPGFNPEGIVAARITLPTAKYSDSSPIETFWRNAINEVRGAGGVGAVTTAEYLPPDFGVTFTRHFNLTQGGLSGGESSLALTLLEESHDYFTVLGIPIIEGRGFSISEEESKLPVVIVNHAMAEKLWPGRSAVGERFQVFPQDPWLTVIGVAGDIAERGLVGGRGIDLMAYRPAASSNVGKTGWIVLRAGPARAASLALELPGLIHRVDSTVVVQQVSSARSLLAESASVPRFLMGTLALFAIVVLAVTMVGVYSVQAYAVARRSREIGIRIALGADKTTVLIGVLRSTIWTTVAGLTVGLLVSLESATIQKSLLYGISPHDPVAIAGALVLLGGATAIASWVPARRATTVDPIKVLRSE